MAGLSGNRVQDEEKLIDELLRINDSDFSRITHIHQSGRAEENYGHEIARLMTPALMAYVESKRRRAGLGDPRGLSTYPQHIDRREWDMMQGPVQNYPFAYDGINKHALRDAAIRRPENAREARLVEMLDNAERRLAEAEKNLGDERTHNAQLRKTFLELFGESVVESSATVQQVPTESVADVRGWRVRIHVPAFTVEATMQELVLARNQQENVEQWMRSFSRPAMVMADARPQITKFIASRILDSSNEMESLESEAVQNKEENK